MGEVPVHFHSKFQTCQPLRCTHTYNLASFVFQDQIRTETRLIPAHRSNLSTFQSQVRLPSPDAPSDELSSLCQSANRSLTSRQFLFLLLLSAAAVLLLVATYSRIVPMGLCLPLIKTAAAAGPEQGAMEQHPKHEPASVGVGQAPPAPSSVLPQPDRPVTRLLRTLLGDAVPPEPRASAADAYEETMTWCKAVCKAVNKSGAGVCGDRSMGCSAGPLRR